MNKRRLLPSLLIAPLLLPAAATHAKTAIEDTLIDACLRLAQADQSNLTSGQLLLRQRCIALRSLRENQGEAAFQAVLKQLSPEQVAGQQRASRNGAQLQSRNVGQRIGHLRASARPAKSLGFHSDEGKQIGASAGSLDAPRWGAFLNGNLDNSSKDATDREPAYDSDATGITAGVDYRISPQWVVGVAVGQTESTTDFVSGTGNIETDASSVMGYVAFNTGGWSVDFVLGTTDSSSRSERKIDYFEDSLGVERVRFDPTGDTDSSDESVYLATDYQFQTGGFSYGPYLALESIKTEVDAFSESQSGGWAIGYAPQSNRLDRYEAGGRASWALSQTWGVLTFGGSLGLNRYEQSELNPLAARLLFDELQTRTFELKPDQLDQDYQSLGLNCSAVFPGGVSAFAAYEEYFGYEDMDISTITMGVRAEL